MGVLRPEVLPVPAPTNPSRTEAATVPTLLPRGAGTRMTHPTSDLGVAVTTAPTATPIGALLEPEGIPHEHGELAVQPPGREPPPPDGQTHTTTTDALPVGTGASNFSLLHGDAFPLASPAPLQGWVGLASRMRRGVMWDCTKELPKGFKTWREERLRCR